MNLYDTMYGRLPNLVIGFHGCDESTFEKVLNQKQMLHSSTNSYDWLGNGMYFWEQNLERAWQWAKESKSVEKPAVLGAVIDLGYCLNLLDSHYLQILKNEYILLKQDIQIAGLPLPKNKGEDKTGNAMLRNLDCAVIEHLHTSRKEANYLPSDSVRGVFWEGDSIYPNTEIKEKNHIQICVRNPNCIKGFFAPRGFVESW